MLSKRSGRVLTIFSDPGTCNEEVYYDQTLMEVINVHGDGSKTMHYRITDTPVIQKYHHRCINETAFRKCHLWLCYTHDGKWLTERDSQCPIPCNDVRYTKEDVEEAPI